MRKIYLFLLAFTALFVSGNSTLAQSVLDPADPVITYNSSNPPAQPTYGQIGKWVRTVRLGWNTTSYKAYIYKGCAFRLKFPKSYNPTANDGKKYPMLVFFHGLGETGNIYDNEYQLYHGGQGFADAVDNGTFDGYILVIQSQGFWGSGQYQFTTEIIDYMVSNNKLDPFRISDNGLSAGGQASWEMLLNHPTYISASVPMSSVSIGYKNNDVVTKLKYTPVWLIQGGLDGSPAPPTAHQVRDAFSNAGGNFTYTEYADLGHGVWNRVWSEPDFYPYILRNYGSNPWPLNGRTEFCPGDVINVTIGLAPGFTAYEWRKNGNIIDGAASNSLAVTDTGVYDARVKRGNVWSGWSYTPAHIKLKEPTIPPTILAEELSSAVIPATDGKNYVNLVVPDNYANYQWKKVGDNTTIGTSNILNVAQPGSYKVAVTEQYGCTSVFSTPFNVINANGNNGPDAASNLIAVALSNTKIELDWANNQNPAFNETAFEIYRSTSHGKSYNYIGKVAANVITYIDSAGLPNTTYYYVIRAINNNAAAQLSNEANATTYSDKIPPSAPENLHVISTTNTSVTIAWDSATDNVGVARYEVYINGIKSYSTDKLNVIATGLDKGKQYIFYVKAKDVSGNYSTQSSQVSAFSALQGFQYKYYEGSWSVLPDFNALTPVKTGNTANIDISVRNRDEQFGFVWQGYIKVPIAGTYTFETSSDDGSKLWLGSYDASATPLVDNDGLHGTQFKAGTITLQPGVYPISAAFFEQGGGQVMELYWTCNELFGDNNRHAITDNYFTDNFSTSDILPVAPTNVIATALDYTRISLTWNDNSTNETAFEIYRANNINGPFQIVKTTNDGATTFTDSGLSPVSTYYYLVKAVNSAGASNGDGLKYSYYTGSWNNLPDFNTLTPVKTGTLNNISLSVATGTTNYAIKYEGNIVIPTDGQYTFYTKSDDGSKLYIGGFDAAHLVVNNDYLQAPTERSGNITLSKGVYPIHITFFQKEGGYYFDASYAGPGISKKLIPDSVFASPAASATTLNLPEAPPAAINGNAVANSSSVITLNWEDVATNETAYKIYRSVGDNLHFKLRTILPSNTGEFVDAFLFANTFYYYKIYTVGVNDIFNSSATLTAKTKNNPPVINNIESRSVRYGVKTIIPVIAFDADNDSLIYSIKNHPAFITLVKNADNTVNLSLKPKVNQQGIYNNIQVIVNDNNGDADTTIFTLTANANYDPSIDSIADYTIAEKGSITINLKGRDKNTTDVLNWTISGAPNTFTLTPKTNTTAKLLLKPNYAAAGSYTINVKVTDGNGGFAIRTFKINVTDKDPNKTIYARFKDADIIGTPWNNITGVTTSNLKDANGNSTSVGMQMQTSWFSTSNGGPTTGNNSGVYPDAVLKNYYYFGIFGGPNSVTVKLTGLDTALKYNLAFLASSSWSGAPDNGTTTFTIGSQTVSQYVQNNTQNTVSINGVKPDATGNINFTMAKAANTPVGYINALIINSVLDDGTAPITPSSLIAEGTGNGVQLSWQDLAYNESNFEIYRSSTQASNYSLIKTTGVNTTGYLDTSSHGSTQYYYKILALNTYGNSAYSNIAGILTSNKIPQLDAINDVIIKNNNQLTIPVIAKDDVTDHVTITVSELPSFVTFADNGDGTGSFLINPANGVTGFYPGIIVTAKDNSDSTSTISFDITVTDQNASSVYLNFSNGSNNAGRPWNNLSGWPFAGTTFNNIKDEGNNSTSVVVTLVDGFEGVVASGMRPGNNKGIYPDAVMRTAEYEGSNSAKTIKISGLSTDKKYNFIFFNSHDDGLNGKTNFTINGETVTLNATYNINKTVQINGITPNENGQVNISVAKANGADFAYISSLIIQAYDNTASLINPSGLTVSENKRTSVSLSWADQSSDENGFEVWRADSTSGNYNLITTVAANATSYTDLGLIQNKTYYYLVRGVNNGNYSGFSNVAVAYTVAYALYINFTVDSIASHPWNNTLAPPQKGYVWDNFVDEANYASGITLTELNEFAGLYTDGNTTGNNSGVFPDAVISQSYGLFPGETAYLKLSGLNLNMSYDLTFFASSRAYGDVNIAYTVNGKRALLNASLNTSGTVTLYNITPDANGEVIITIAPGTTTSQFGLIGALVVKGYSKPVLTVPAQQPLFFTKPISSSSSSEQKIAPLQKVSNDFGNINAYPNPFSGNFTLSLTMKQDDDVQVGIYDISGKPVYQRRFNNLLKGNNFLKIVPQNGLSNGIYIVKVTMIKQNENKVLKLIKQN